MSIQGVGGIFYKVKDLGKLRAWYKDMLGVDFVGEESGASLYTTFPCTEKDARDKAYTHMGLFAESTDYFEPSNAPFMINMRVDKIEAMVAHLKARGATLKGELAEEPEGKFAWVLDPEGVLVELWEPPVEG